MQKTTQTNLNKRLASRNSCSRKAKNSKTLFSQRRISNLGPSNNLTKTIEFYDRKDLIRPLVQLGTVAGFKGLRGYIYVKATTPVWEIFSLQGREPDIFNQVQVFFRLENKFFEATVSKSRVGREGFYFTLEGWNTKTDVANLRFSEVLIHRETVAGALISQVDSYVGFTVINIEGQHMGTILEVGGTKHQTYLKTSTTIIPNVSNIVIEINKDSKTVLVDWSDTW